MSFYRTGTLSLTNGSATVTGSGTDFISGAAIGECVQAPDGKLYEIITITSATGLTLGQVYLGSTASGQSYSIVPTQSYIRDLAGQAATLVNGFATTRDNAVLLTVADKTTPVDADKVALKDSATGFAKWLTWANLKATLKTYLSGVAFPIGATTPSTGAFTTLSATGNAAIGATPGSAALAIQKGAGVSALVEIAGNNNSLGTTSVLIGQDGSNIGYVWNRANAPLTFGSNNAQVMSLSSTGLAVTGGISASGTLYSGGSFSTPSDVTAGVDASTMDAPFLKIWRGGGTGQYGTVNMASGALKLDSTTGFVQLYSNGSLKAEVSSTGLAVTGGISASSLISANGNIKFPAIQSPSGDANTLDDYEEGTFTVTYRDSGSVGNASSTTGIGTYTKIGRCVTVTMRCDNISTVGLTAGNTLSISGLPFVPTVFAQGSFYSYRVGGGTAQTASLSVANGATYGAIFLYTGTSATTDIPLKVSDLVSGVSSIYTTLTYFA